MKLILLVHSCFILFSIQEIEGEKDKFSETCFPSCPKSNGWEEKAGHCFFWPGLQMTWAEAEKFCNAKLCHLASVTNQEIHNFIRSKVNPENSASFFWVGGTDQEEEGEWKWTDGSDWSYTKWATQPKQPDDAHNDEDCLQITLNDFDGWNDINCGNNYQFVCSQRICQDDIVTTTTTTNNNNTDNNNNSSSSDKDIVLAVALPFGIILIVIIFVVCKYKCSKKKKEKNVKVDENEVYGVYQLGGDYERRYSTNEVVDNNLYYEQ